MWVLRNQAVLTQLPVWLFSVCPPGTDFMDNEQQPEEKAEFQQAIRPRDHRVSFGALDHSRLFLVQS